MVRKHSTDAHENTTSIQLILKSDIVTIEFADENGNCGDIIQESIDTIQVDEEEIPEFVKSMQPEALKAAHLREETWRIGGEHAVYLNIPEDYSPVIADDGKLLWASSDESTRVYAEEVHPSYRDNNELDIENMLKGTEKLDNYGARVYHSMYSLDYLYEDMANNLWVYTVYVQPYKHSDNIGNTIPGILITVVGPYKGEVQLDDALATLLYADGFSHTGILDIDAVATQES